MNLEKVRLGHVISDLHVFTRWSSSDAYMPEIHAAAARSDFFVLNGDIFDFRWTTHPKIEDSIEAAVAWLRDLTSKHSGCRFYYVIGNHDGHPLFVERLDAFARSIDNLEWHSSHIRIGDRLFVHGDLPLKFPRKNAFNRELTNRFWNTSGLQHLLYRFCFLIGAHRLVARLHSRHACATQIARALDADGSGAAEGVAEIYFGHTHAPFAGYEYGDRAYHNSGSTIRGLRMNMMEIRTDVKKGPER